MAWKKPPSPYVNLRTPERVRFGLPEHLAGDRRGILAEREELEQVDDRVALRPANELTRAATVPFDP